MLKASAILNPAALAIGLGCFLGVGFVGAQSLTIPASTGGITNAAQVRQLPSSAAEGLPVRVRGVVTYYDEANLLAYVQDPTAGTRVETPWEIVEPGDFSGPIAAGMLVELSGYTRLGKFAPIISHHPTVRVLGRVEPLPKPMEPLWGSLLEPTFHSQWVVVKAFVRTADFDKGRLRLGLICGPRHIDAFVTGDWTAERVPAGLLLSDIEVRGVYGSIFNDRRQLVDMRLLVPSTNQITVIDPGMALAFAQEPRSIGEIMQFNPNETNRIHVRGIVLAQLSGEGLYLRGDDGAIWVGTEFAGQLKRGQAVSVAGYPSAGGIRPVLQYAIVKVLDEIGALPLPVELSAEQVLDQPVDCDLVTVEARLVGLLERPGNSLLEFRSERTTFSARLLDTAPIAGQLELGNLLKLTGICVMKGEPRADAQSGKANLPTGETQGSFSLIIRDQADIELLHTPPWWTLGRIRNLLLGMAVLTAGVFLWGVILRRKVSEQTALIIEGIESERVAEERVRIARELHDTLEQELVGIKMALDTVASRMESAPEKARQSLDRARAMVRRSQTEARQSVWDLRAANLASENLDDALKEMLGPLSQLEGAALTVETDWSPQQEFDGVAKNHILRIAQESVTNALKHAQADRIVVRLQSGREGLELCITDDGSGFDVSEQDGKNGHFGLIGMRERANKLKGRLLVQSEAGKGSTIRLIMPLKPAEES